MSQPSTLQAPEQSDAGLIKFEWLYAFVILTECGNFSVAAERLYVTQQALSKTIAQLENQLGAQVLQRRPWQLTPAGEHLLREARQILQRANRIEDGFQQQLAAAMEGPLRIGLVGEPDAGLLATCKSLLRQHPKLRLHLHTDLPAAELEKLLSNQQLDLALMPCQPRAKGLKCLPYASSAMVLVATGGPSDWQQHKHIACTAPEPLGQMLKWPETAHPRQVLIETDVQTAVELAIAGQGAVWLPEYLVAAQLAQGSLKRLPDPPFRRRLHYNLVWATRCGPNPLQQMLIEALRPD